MSLRQKIRYFLLACSGSACFLVGMAFAGESKQPEGSKTSEQARWLASAKHVTILRDKWGIPHVFGKTDADAVFGLLYAQAEDDFNRIELNYINAMGRLAEVEGEAAIWRDLRMKLYIQPAAMQVKFQQSPPWLKKLMVSFADGLNYYLYKHPEVKPKLIAHFEPWMALTFSEGSIGGDIEEINLNNLEKFYGSGSSSLIAQNDNGFDAEPRGSNGFAIAPKLTSNGHALLLINPHTSFYFRPEVHMVSQQGLNAYGAVTWGQFFVYQGFNQHLGWMHTSGGGDVIDEYLETITEKNGQFFYQYENEERAVIMRPITLPYKTASGMASKTINAYFTHHGPIIRAQDGKWISIRMMEEPLKALMQSYGRTKTKDYQDFYRIMQLRTNSSNNTVYADDKGNIAYFHGNFIPKRDPRFDWRKPVDGSIAATEWRGLHEVKDTIHLLNPQKGWIQNTNNWPFTVSGAVGAPDSNSPLQQDYPHYMWTLPENARGIHALRVLEGAQDLSIDRLIAKAYDRYLTAFEPLIPALLQAYAMSEDNQLKSDLAEQVACLQSWDLRFAIDSVPTSLAIYWAQDMVKNSAEKARAADIPVLNYIRDQISPQERLDSLRRAIQKLNDDFGSWETPWGNINRFQRISGDIQQQYDDNKASYPVAFTSANWGSLAAFGMSAQQKTKRIYGDRGNSFVAAVEFGPHLKAKSILAGGNSGNPLSKHFDDQAEMYSKGKFKEVLFYPADIKKNLEKEYHPGE